MSLPLDSSPHIAPTTTVFAILHCPSIRTLSLTRHHATNAPCGRQLEIIAPAQGASQPQQKSFKQAVTWLRHDLDIPRQWPFRKHPMHNIPCNLLTNCSVKTRREQNR